VDLGDSFKAVKIRRCGVSAGTVQLDGVDISANATFTAAQISGGHLTFKPRLLQRAGSLSFAVRGPVERVLQQRHDDAPGLGGERRAFYPSRCRRTRCGHVLVSLVTGGVTDIETTPGI